MWLSIAVVTATIFRLWLSSGLMMYFVSGTMYDDLMQISKAFSIAEGRWLGEYGPMTLVKGVGFPLIAALIHFLNVPFITSFHFIYILGCIAFAWAIRPVVKNDLILFLAYIFVLFNPIAFSADITKYYRDIVYYAMCMVFISLTAGILLRAKGNTAAALAGFSLGLCVLIREDCQWLYIYAAVCLIFIVVKGAVIDKNGFASGLKCIISFALTFAALILSICFVNYIHYQTFTIDEYNSGAYADAYGAVSRLHPDDHNTHIVIPEQNRKLLYENCPSFAVLQPLLDGGDPRFEPWKIYAGEYRSGYFSFNLRDAIAARGYFQDAPSTNDYMKKMADEINSYCDENLPDAYPKHSGIVSRFYIKDVPNIMNSMAKGIISTLKYENVSCIPIPCNEDDKYIKIFEEFTNSTIAANRYMESGETISNYHLSGLKLWAQRFMRVIIIVYQFVTLPLFLICCVANIIAGIKLVREKSNSSYMWFILLSGFLRLYLLRCFMIGYVDATTFSAVANPAYQAGSYVVLGMFISSGLAFFRENILRDKRRK